MWHRRIWFSRHGGVGGMVGLDDLRGLFQPMILWSSQLESMETSNYSDKIKEETLFFISYGPDPNGNRREAQYLGVLHSNTSNVLIWYKKVR